MVTTLSINPGSSSKKYALFQDGVEVFSVRFEHTTKGFGKCVTVRGAQNRCEPVPDSIYSNALHECLALARAQKVISRFEEIERVGVRIVAPHSYFTTHRVIDTRFMNVLESLKVTAPLHVPYLIEEVRAAEEMLPHALLVGVSDSAFHTSMPAHASLYSVPEQDREKFHLYRYGYHGLSVASVVRTITTLQGALPSRLIVVHVGSGVSVTAVKEGKSIDTTMGFSPASGLIMSTRGGDIDASALIHLGRAKGYTNDDIETYLNTETGLRGLVGTADLRVVIDRAERGEYKAQRALHAFLYGIHKSMHAFYGVLGGVDAVVLTATAVERNATVRSLIMDAFSYLGAEINETVNEELYERAGKITTDASKVNAYMIPTREMLEITLCAESFPMKLS